MINSSYNMAADIFDLAAGTKLQIVSYIPVRDTVRLGMTCRDVRELVLVNAQHLSRQVCTRERRRIDAFINHNILFAKGTSFLDAFSRWGAHRHWSTITALLSNPLLCTGYFIRDSSMTMITTPILAVQVISRGSPPASSSRNTTTSMETRRNLQTSRQRMT